MGLIIGLCWGIGGAVLLMVLGAIGRRNRRAKIEALRALTRDLPEDQVERLLEQYKDDL